MDFELLGEITDIETVAAGTASDISHACSACMAKATGEHEGGARFRLRNGGVRLAEIHWYEARGIDRKEFKRKRYLDKAKARRRPAVRRQHPQ